MERERGIWRVLGALFLVCLGVGYGLLAARKRWFPVELLVSLKRAIQQPAEGSQAQDPYGRWGELGQPAMPDDDSAQSGLESIGYAGGYEEALSGAGGVLLRTPAMAPGLTLLCSGHEPTAMLLDGDGELVHSWKVSFEAAFGGETLPDLTPSHREFLRRAHVFPNGDLLALFEYAGLVKLDRDSQVLWSDLGKHHHDFQVLEDGSCVALTDDLLGPEEVAERFPGLHEGASYRDNSLVFLDPGGEELQRISILEAFYRSDYAQYLASYLERGGRDPLHSNSVDVIRHEAQRWSERIQLGDVVISARSMNTVFVLRPSTSRVVWMAVGRWYGQHQASVLKNGNLLLLDNKGGNPEDPLRQDASRVLEWDPRSDRITWSYSGSQELPFFTHWLGYVERLENGNTLITESSQGRLLEVTPSGELAWLYLSPYRSGEADELIATLMGAKRIPRQSLDFLE